MQKQSDFLKRKEKRWGSESRGPGRSPPPARSSPGTRPAHVPGLRRGQPAALRKGRCWHGSERAEARVTARAPAGGRLPWHGEPRRGKEPRAAKRAPRSSSVAPGRTLREGAGRGRLGGALAAASPPGRRQNAPWIPAAGAGFAAPHTPPTPPRSGVTRHGPGDRESGGSAPTAAHKNRRRRAWLVPPGVI